MVWVLFTKFEINKFIILSFLLLTFLKIDFFLLRVTGFFYYIMEEAFFPQIKPHIWLLYPFGKRFSLVASLFTVHKWGNPQCFHLPPGFWPMGCLGISSVPHLTITTPLVNRLCSNRWNYRRCQSPHKGCRLAFTSKLIIRKPWLSPK